MTTDHYPNQEETTPMPSRPVGYVQQPDGSFVHYLPGRKVPEAFRFNDIDRGIVVDRLTATINQWATTPTHAGGAEVDMLVRSGGHALGCASLDLRDIELYWITLVAVSLLGGWPT